MKTGVIGLGAMGGGVTNNLLKAGFTVHVFDVMADRMQFFADKGAAPMKSYAQLANESDVILTFLPMSPYDPTLENVILGEDGVLVNMRKDSILIDCGNTSPQMAILLNQKCVGKGCYFMDVPVSGGPEGAAAGTLSAMVGGERSAFERCVPVFQAISSKFSYFGEAGMGQMAKLVNNMIVANNLATLSEALIFATKAGLNPDQLLQAMSEGAANSWVLRTYGPAIMERDAKGCVIPGGGFSGIREGGRDKQLAWALQMADDLETPLPVTALSYQLFQMARGLGKKGLCEPILEMYEDMTDLELLQKNYLHKSE